MNIGLIVAAGRGHRFGGPLPKQYRELAGMPILRHTILRLARHPGIDAIQVLIHPDDQALYDEATVGLGLRPALHGGATRQDSVRFGLEGIADLQPKQVLIHDEVRPFVALETISAVLAALERVPAAIAGVPLADTLKRVTDGVISETVDRRNLWRAQTPQGFDYASILAAHRSAAMQQDGIELTDDAMVAEKAGLTVEMVAGSEENFKITTEMDLQRAAFLLRLEAGG
jgi:2-C-methyl-D-erythritol 4-phosphate cytidylyltransferase